MPLVIIPKTPNFEIGLSKKNQLLWKISTKYIMDISIICIYKGYTHIRKKQKSC